jgi:hypothetical protein
LQYYFKSDFVSDIALAYYNMNVAGTGLLFQVPGAQKILETPLLMGSPVARQLNKE